MVSDGKLVEEGNGYQVDRSASASAWVLPILISLWDGVMTSTTRTISLGLMFTGRFGGVVTSQTQAFMDAFGVSKVSAEARDNGGVMGWTDTNTMLNAIITL